jgi:tetratricopeptide (TPR) repeat protein
MRHNPSLERFAIAWVSPLFVLLAFGALSTGCIRSAEDHLRAASDAMYSGNARVALHEYQQALQIAARDDSPRAERVQARALRGAADACYFELREAGRAADLYRDLIRTHPDAPETLEARVNLAQILRIDLHDLRGAIAELAAAIARQPPQTDELRYEMAKLYFELGDYTQCALESDAIHDGHGTSAVAARAAFLKADALAMIEGRNSEAIHFLEELLERFPGCELQPFALYELGRIRADAGDLEAAIEQWVRALKTHPHPGFIQAAIARARRRLEQSSSAADSVAAAFLANAAFDGLSSLRRAKRNPGR